MLTRAFFVTACIAAMTVPALAGATATPPPAAGGSFQRSSVEGCMGDWLSDGVWRVKVLSVDPSASYNDGSQTMGVGVKLQVRNATNLTLAPDDTGFSDISGNGIDLVYSDENSVNVSNSGSGLSSRLSDKKLAPSAASTVILYFPYSADKTAKPVKMLIAVDPKKNRTKARYTVKSPSFRIHLDCGTLA